MMRMERSRVTSTATRAPVDEAEAEAVVVVVAEAEAEAEATMNPLKSVKDSCLTRRPHAPGMKSSLSSICPRRTSECALDVESRAGPRTTSASEKKSAGSG